MGLLQIRVGLQFLHWELGLYFHKEYSTKYFIKHVAKIRKLLRSTYDVLTCLQSIPQYASLCQRLTQSYFLKVEVLTYQCSRLIVKFKYQQHHNKHKQLFWGLFKPIDKLNCYHFQTYTFYRIFYSTLEFYHRSKGFFSKRIRIPWSLMLPLSYIVACRAGPKVDVDCISLCQPSLLCIQKRIVSVSYIFIEPACYFRLPSSNQS